ncbi:hypothetical protein D3C87_1982100 [compost metagenome]
MLIFEVVPVTQEQPTTLLDHFARGLVMAQRVGLVDPDAIDHIATITGYDME